MLKTRTLGSEGLTASAIGLGLMGMSQAYGAPEEYSEGDFRRGDPRYQG
ncbi:MAG: hypothetical protein HOQ26_07780, partial [Gemmatimonadaceae bacterium]|nr:hypothetical protein [Gemmatimonadaceae bacterium]